jgi:uncharacterized membrane protein
MASVLLVLGDGNLLAILLLLFVPGYALVSTLFPGSTVTGDSEIDWIERIALSFGLSIAIVPLLALILGFTPWGIRFAPVISSNAILTIGLGCAAYWRRMRLPPERRLSATVELAVPAWRGYSPLEKALTVALGASLVVGAGGLAYTALAVRPGEGYTEFYLLGPSGNASGYPSKLSVSQPGRVILSIVNHESATVSYTTRVDLVGVRVEYNSTTGRNETLVLNRTTWSWINVTRPDGENWSQSYIISIGYSGFWKVQFLLFKDGNFSRVYRELHLYIRVA